MSAAMVWMNLSILSSSSKYSLQEQNCRNHVVDIMILVLGQSLKTLYRIQIDRSDSETHARSALFIGHICSKNPLLRYVAIDMTTSNTLRVNDPFCLLHPQEYGYLQELF